MALPAPQYLEQDDIGGQIAWTREGFAQLEALAAARGETPEEYIAAAVGLAQWVDTVLANGGSVVARPAHGPWEVLRSKRT